MKSLIGLAAIVLLSSCGGGGGGGAGSPAPGDGSVPTLVLTAPAALADDLAGTLSITAAASDEVGVAAVEFQVDGLPLAEDMAAPYEAALDTAAHAAGQHVVRARARDAAGNTSAWSSATVRFGGNAAAWA